MGDQTGSSVYPRYCFHLAPTVNTWCLMHVRAIHALDQHAGFEGENFYFYRNLPIKWVRIVGVVVAVDEFFGRRVYTVDDSSGACIECTVIVASPPKDVRETKGEKEPGQAGMNGDPAAAISIYDDIDIGSVVDVKGGLSTWRDEKKINIEKMHQLRGTAQEVALWEKRSRFQADVLSKPWVLRDKDVRRCRQQAERSEEQAQAKKRRLKAMIDGRAAQQPSTRGQAESSTGKPRKDGDRRSNATASLDLGQILRRGGGGQYDALGL